MPSSYAEHSRWSDPGRFADAIDVLPHAVSALPDLIGGLVIHPQIAAARNIAVPEAAREDVRLRTVPAMLSAIIARSAAPLAESRPVERRLFASCQHFALLAAAILRQHGIEARLRAGFATYFTPGHFVDHWVCEYRDGAQWRLLDAELGSETRQASPIAFAPEDVPRTAFVVAAPMWQAIRSGARDPAKVGVPAIGIAGAWFAAASLLRDAAALAKQEVQPWDYWGLARELGPGAAMSPAMLAAFDALAADLAHEPGTVEDCERLLARHNGVALTPTVVSFPAGRPEKMSPFGN
jgi:hypothetical protein